jgi:hypothetical protein
MELENMEHNIGAQYLTFESLRSFHCVQNTAYNNNTLTNIL